MKKRTNYISWENYFMGIAWLSAKRSKDPSTQVGTCVVNHQNRIVAIGYNGLADGIDDDDINWAREGEYLQTKYPFVIHAEQNAILNAVSPLNDCTLYTTNYPCDNCAKMILQSKIRKVVYLEDKHSNSKFFLAAKQIFLLGKIEISQIKNFSLKFK